MKNNKQPFQYWQSGLDYIYLLNGVEWYEHNNELFYKIQEIDSLHELIAQSIIQSSNPIRGMELRFLRSLLGLSQASLGAHMGRKRDVVAKAEAKSHEKVNGAIDRLIRFIYAGTKSNPREIKRMIDLMDDIAEEEYQHEINLNYKNGWNAEVA